MPSNPPPLFKGVLTHPTTKYVGLPMGAASVLALHVAWLDATSSATITLETTEFPASEAPVEEAGAAWEWFSETGITITGPTAAAASSSMTHMSNVGASRARLKIVTAATCDLEVRCGVKVP